MKVARALTASIYFSKCGLRLGVRQVQIKIEERFLYSHSKLNFIKHRTGQTLLNIRLQKSSFSVKAQNIKMENSSLVETNQNDLREGSSENITNGLENGINSLIMNSKSGILRYQPNSERYDLTCSFHKKTFNFNRSASEAISIFLDRLIANVSKKVKHFEGNVNLFINDQAVDKTDNLATIIEKLNSSNATPKLSLQIDNDIIQININPPEVYKIKFLKCATVGFPILPTKLEGSPNFNSKSSKYLWEFTRVNNLEVQQTQKKSNRKSSLPRTCIWSPCPTKDNNHLSFVPDESLVGANLRLTITPSNDGINFGDPLSADVPVVVSVKTSKKFLFEERLERLDPKPTIESNPNFLRVVTYNTLADTYATKEWFSSSPEDSLPIDYRLPIINHELKVYQGDIICLQEIDDKYFESHFEPFLSYCGFKGLFSCKTRDTKEGVAFFYNEAKFKAEECTTLVIGDHMKTLHFYNSTLQKYDNIIENLNERNTVLQVAALESLVCPETLLLVGNTHLYFYPDADHIRLLQTITCLDYLEAKSNELQTKYPNKKVVVLFCGDFNCTPPFSSFRAITSGKIEETDYDWTSHETEKLDPGIKFSHMLDLINTHPDHELTNLVANFEGCLDYIFYQPTLKLLKIYPPPSKATIAQLCGIEESKVSLPNYQSPSDHVPLIADFSL